MFARIILVLGLLCGSWVYSQEHVEVTALDLLPGSGDWYKDTCLYPNVYAVRFKNETKFYENARPRQVYSGNKIVLEERAYSLDAEGNRIVFCGYFLYDEQGVLIHWFDTTDFELSRTKNGYKLMPLDRSIDNREAYAPNFGGLKPYTL